MSGNDSGGPVFPRPRDGSFGVDLRDWIAVSVLPTLAHAWIVGEVDDYEPKHFAVDAYRIADAMIAERAKERAK